jgi:hypothetical protein
MIKGFVFLFCFFFILALNAQFTDDFSDGNFSENPSWIGDEEKFSVNEFDQLQLTAIPESSDAYLSTSSGAINDAQWDFYVRMDFNPSSTNYARIYLSSNSSDLRNALNGYFVYIGGTTDEISLYRQTGTTRTRILQGVAGSVNTANVAVRIRVTRDETGNWELLRDTSLTDVFVSEGVVFDDTFIQTSFSGVYCDYTATRSDKFFFDDFVVTGTPFLDVIPPNVVSVLPTSENTLDLLFDEPISLESATLVSNYTVNFGIGLPLLAQRDEVNTALIHLTFATNFVDGAVHEIQISDIEDLSGNSTGNLTESFFFYSENEPEIGDIRINEVMANEHPSVGQPLTEYIELFNTTSKTFDLTNWRICNDNSCGTIQNSLLLPNGYLIIVPTSGINEFPNVPSINATSFPTLKNGGDEVWLKNPEQAVFDMMFYTLSTYQDVTKSKGGYSLELINPILPCSGEFNWRVTSSPTGGTPGLINAVYDNSTDTIPPSIVAIYTTSSSSCTVYFSEIMDSVELVNTTITSSPFLGALELVCPNRFSNILHVNFEHEMIANTSYLLILLSLSDCSGNTQNVESSFILPDTAIEGDVVVNEILFNPLTGGSDYVELYNSSQKVIDLANWKIANFTDTIANLKTLSTAPLLLFPDSYLVLTKDSVHVKQNFINHGWGRFLQCELPSYPNASGSVILLNSVNEVLDRVDYSEKWHFRLIDDKKGKALERIQAKGESSSASNWQTASETVGFGTPGIRNSQQLASMNATVFTIDPAVISPDNDGYQDFALIQYDLPESGMVGTILIVDEQGRHVRELVNNHYFDLSGTLKWDGLRDDGSKCAVGRYILLFDVYSYSGGSRIQQRKVVVVATKL